MLNHANSNATSMPVASMELRPYQNQIVDAARHSVMGGNKKVIIHAATGAGKTIIAGHIISSATEKGSKVLFLANRRELIKQSSKRLNEYGVEHGIIMAGKESKLQESVQVASMQTYIRRMQFEDNYLNPWFHDADLIVVDECHTSISPSYQKILKEYNEKVVVLGLTATPARGDQRGLGEYYDDIVSVVSMRELVNDSYLVPARYFAPSTPDLEKIKTIAGDYDKKELGRRMNKEKLVGDILENWLRIAPKRQTVIFAVNVAHSVAIKKQFESQGVSIEHMDAKTPSDERDEILNRLHSGDVQVVTNVGILCEGMDFPIVSCIVLARPTKSLPLYLQMAGRGVRVYPDKKDCIIIDHGGCINNHGFIDDDFYWELSPEEKAWKRKKPRQAEKKPATCRGCKEVFSGTRTCPVCGTELKSMAKKIKTVDAELNELKAGKKRNKETDKITKIQILGALLHHARKKGYRDGWAAHKYKEYFGAFPRGLGNVGPIEPEVREIKNKIKYILIKSAKSYQKRMQNGH